MKRAHSRKGQNEMRSVTNRITARKLFDSSNSGKVGIQKGCDLGSASERGYSKYRKSKSSPVEREI